MKNKQNQSTTMRFPKESSVTTEEEEGIIDEQKEKVKEIIDGEILGEYIKIDVETLIDKNIKHTLNNLLCALQGQYYLLRKQNPNLQKKFNFKGIADCIENGEEFSFDLFLESLGKGGEIKKQTYYKKILNTIDSIYNTIAFSSKMRLKKRIFI